jgi:2-hydroxychromene-2-carboxylate isomerase
MGEEIPMSKSLDFYFDFSSPYGYLAATRVDNLAARHGATVNWRPILLGAVFKVTNAAPLTTYPMKGDYARHDWERAARRYGVPFRMPAQFPFGTVIACRAYYHLHQTDPEGAVRFAKALYHAAFGEGRDICPVEAIGAIAEAGGFDAEDILTGIQRASVKEQLKGEVEGAIRRGVFGSPFFMVGNEGFWGNDRLDEVADWLDRGGW